MISRLLVLLVLAALPAWSGAWDARSVAGWVLRSGGAVRLAGGEYLRDLSLLPAGNLTITGIDFTGTLVEPEQLDRISELTSLEELLVPAYMWNEGAGSRRDSNDLLANLSGLKNLKRFHVSIHFLEHVQIQDKGLEKIAGLTQLEEMRLAQTRIKGMGLKPFVNLRSLDMRYSALSDQGMESLEGMHHLERLILRDTLVTDAGIAHVAGLTNLQELDLYGLTLTDEGVRALAGLKHLRKLNLLGSSVTDTGAAVLAGLPELVELNLYRNKITNAGLAKLAGLKNLQFLDARYTRVTETGVAQLRAARPQAII